MKSKRFSIDRLCSCYGITRQAYYRYLKRKEISALNEEIVLEFVSRIRRRHPMIGSKKLYFMLRLEIIKMGYKIGRDKFIRLLRNNHMLIKRKKQYVSTSDSNHGYNIYSNLLKEVEVTRTNQVFVSDLTYLSTYDRFYFLSLVSDVYSRKIVGYCLSNNLKVEGSMKAIKCALRKVSNPAGLIHHSDRGFQYCSMGYVQYLEGKKVQISMSAKGNPYDNAIAERIIGILKQEYMLGIKFRSYNQMKKAVFQAIKMYNTERPHFGIGMEIPSERYAA